jgi:hypothetical protein
MQKNILFSAITMALLLGGCGDKSELEESAEKVSSEKSIPSKKEHNDAKPSSISAGTLIDEVPALASDNVSTDEVASHFEAMAKSVSSAEVAKSVSKVERARAHASVEITGALASVETGELEEDERAHADAKALQRHQAQAHSIIQEEVYKVEAAKAASSAKIAASVKSVMDARAAIPVRDPLPATVLSVVKAKATSAVAKSISAVEIVKAQSASNMAKATAKVEMHKRIYGEGSPEVNAAKAQASGIIAQAVGSVKVAEAQALGEISESVAEVEIAKVKAGVVRDEVVKGQKIYLTHMKKPCGINGAKFAAKHTQQEWEGLREEGAFIKEAQKICPNMKTFDNAWMKNLFEFSYEYASDSGHVPSCG